VALAAEVRALFLVRLVHQGKEMRAVDHHLVTERQGAVVLGVRV
jgi:hypothetical protein